MVLHVARALHVVGLEGGAGELAEHRGVGLAHHVHERVQAAAMRHADGDGPHPVAGGLVDDGVQRRDRRLAALEPEALGADIALLAERLEALGLVELAQDRLLLVGAERGPPVAPLNARLQPLALQRVLHVHELRADRAAIGRADGSDHVAHRRRVDPEQHRQRLAEIDRAVHVLRPEAVGGGVEVGMRLGHLQAERVEPRLQVTADTVGAQQLHRPQAVVGAGADLRGRGGRRRGRPDVGDGGLRVRPGRRGGLVRTLDLEPARRPGGARRILADGDRFLVQGGEQLDEARIHAARIGHPACIQIGQEGGIAAIKGSGQYVDARHGALLSRSRASRYTELVTLTVR